MKSYDEILKEVQEGRIEIMKNNKIIIMINAMKDIRERDMINIRKVLKNNGLLTSTRDLLNIELHRLQREIETLEEVVTRWKSISEDDK